MTAPGSDPTPLPRSYLYVPGDRPEMLAKATARGADAVIADLEDAVPSADKPMARRNVAEWLDRQTGDTELWVRVNSLPSDMDEDLRAIGESPALAGVVVAKVEDAAVVEKLPLHLAVQPLVESARGVLVMVEVSKAARVERLQLGEADLSADLGVPFDDADTVLGPIRLQVVVASAAARLQSPVAPVSTNFKDLGAFEQSTRHLRSLGFGARAVIHPAQAEVANRVFAPSPEEVEKAERTLAAAAEADGGVFVDEDGQMVDEAILRNARRILSLRR